MVEQQVGTQGSERTAGDWQYDPKAGTITSPEGPTL